VTVACKDDSTEGASFLAFCCKIFSNDAMELDFTLEGTVGGGGGGGGGNDDDGGGSDGEASGDGDGSGGGDDDACAIGCELVEATSSCICTSLKLNSPLDTHLSSTA
jgi:hypothetical protein